MTTAAELFALQETDLAIDGAVAKLNDIEAQLGESEELIAARERAELSRQTVQEIQARQKDLDVEAEEARAKAGEIEKKLYGGGVSNPKELEGYEADLTSLRGQLRKREDALLEVMLELEEAEAALKEAEAGFAQAEAAWKADQGSLIEGRTALQEELSGLQAVRSNQIDGMDRAALSLYEAIRQRRNGTAIALVERGLCQGCRISLPMSILQRARSGTGLIQCVSCERILLVN
jgi:predicted  nucleic acid-binding Zn-ribbon protein